MHTHSEAGAETAFAISTLILPGFNWLDKAAEVLGSDPSIAGLEVSIGVLVAVVLATAGEEATGSSLGESTLALLSTLREALADAAEYVRRS